MKAFFWCFYVNFVFVKLLFYVSDSWGVSVNCYILKILLINWLKISLWTMTRRQGTDLRRNKIKMFFKVRHTIIIYTMAKIHSYLLSIYCICLNNICNFVVTTCWPFKSIDNIAMLSMFKFLLQRWFRYICSFFIR